MDIKLIALDLDGTLLLPDKTLSEKNRDTLIRASQENGIHIVLATGRTCSGVNKILEWIPCIRYVVLSNGAVVQDTWTGEVIAEHCIKNEDAVAFYDYAVSQKLTVDFFYQGKRFVSPDWDDCIRQMEISEGTKQLLLSNCTKVEKQRAYLEGIPGVEKISIRFRNEKLKKQLYNQIEEMFPQLKICSSLETNIEANCKYVTKATGIQDLIEYLGIHMNSVMAFGDNGNDYEMLSAAGIGVAMGNSTPEIKAAADKITRDNTEDGVAYMVREVLGWQQA